jgi:hypothetical protein
MAIDMECGADAHQRIHQRRDGDAQGDRRRRHPQIFRLSGKAKAFIAAEPIRVPMIAGRVQRAICLRGRASAGGYTEKRAEGLAAAFRVRLSLMCLALRCEF